MPASPDLTSLTDDVIISLGGWDPRYARVVMIAVDDDEAMALVDGNGGGNELEQEFWTREPTGWRPGSSSGGDVLSELGTSIWDAGHAVCGFGSASPGETVRIRYDGDIHECQANQFGVWGFIRKVEYMNAKHPLPELLDEDPDIAQARRQMEEKAEVVRERVRAKMKEMRGPPTD